MEICRYYKEQAGSGISGFEGSQYQYQKGKGFFGRLLKGIALPVLKYFGSKALETGRDIASDVLEGQNFKKAGKRRLAGVMESIGSDAKRKIKKVLSGNGLRGIQNMAPKRMRPKKVIKKLVKKGIKRKTPKAKRQSKHKCKQVKKKKSRKPKVSFL